MWIVKTLVIGSVAWWAAQVALEGQEQLVPAGDNFKITADASIKPGSYLISDIDDNGVIHITGEGITVDFRGAEVVGVPATRSPETYVGKGIVVSGKNITIQNVKVRGFKVGIYARKAPGLLIDGVDVSGNFRQRLQSTPRREYGGDWLSPHHNDNGEWVANYGAGLFIQESDGVTVRRVRARNVQNGIILDRVNESKVYDNDCSFLSGWGLALWRCERNLISRNAFDFCVRGYSHGIYSRGQDSAGILMFEQNNHNVIAENSATHCGDGLFGFGGVASLAGTGRTGNNSNLIVGNDFSYAAAHGIEMTFSFDNRIINNRLVDNAICGIWAGYSQDTMVAGNTLVGNGKAGYGLERGGVNIEHGRGNVIKYNGFAGNECGVFLWWDEDEHLAGEPWVKANEKGSRDNSIVYNTFERDELAIQLRTSSNTVLTRNSMSGVARDIDADAASIPKMVPGTGELWRLPKYRIEGEAFPIDARKHLAGRERIIMTEWGPCDYTEYAVMPARYVGGKAASLQVVGPKGKFRVTEASDGLVISPLGGDVPGVVNVEAARNGITEYKVALEAGGEKLTATGTLLRAEWDVHFFEWSADQDPRTKPEEWKALVAWPPPQAERVPAIEYYWGRGSPSTDVPADHFGTTAGAAVELAAGSWRVTTISDDGVRVWIDNKKVIDNWTWHPPTEDSVVVELAEGEHHIRIEHFEIDGHAQLHFMIERAR